MTNASLGCKNAFPAIVTILLLGCSPAPAKRIWRASVDHGDKPGIGIELHEAANQLSGFIYLLDPNRPPILVPACGKKCRFSRRPSNRSSLL
jgi:hypothetical protein